MCEKGEKEMKRKFLVLGMALSIALAVVLALTSTALAATNTLTASTTLSGSRTLSVYGITAISPLGTWATFDLVTELQWTQAADISATFDPNLVRQGRSLDPSVAYTRPAPGSMTVTWTLSNLQIGWDGVGPLDLGSPSFSASGAGNLLAGGPDYTCHLDSGQITLFPPGGTSWPYLGPYVKLGMAADVTVSPQGIATIRQAVFGGIPDGTADLILGESPITDSVAISCCGVGAGDELIYTLGPLSTTPGVTVTSSLVFEVGAAFPDPIVPGWEHEVAFDTASIPLDSVSSSIEMTGPGVMFDMGAVLPNNIPPIADAGGPYTGNEGSPITFDGSGSSSICGAPTLRWDFSDGGVAFGESPQHTFQGPGIYSGLLTATDCTGLSSWVTFSIDVRNLPPVANAGPDMSAKWGRPVILNGSALNPGTDQQPYLTYEWDFGDGTPSASGGASVIHVYSLPGVYTATLTACDPQGACGSDTVQIVVGKRDVKVAYLGAYSGIYDTAATFSASLVDEFGQKVSGRIVLFMIGGEMTGAITDSNGIATASHVIGLTAGVYGAYASFLGDSLYNADTSLAAITVTQKSTILTYAGPLSSLPSKTVTLSAVLTDATGKPLAGRSVVFQLGAQGPFTATTDSSGVASYKLRLSQKPGSYPLTVTFTPAGADVSKYFGTNLSLTFKIRK
jgi:PKD repeat protein